MIIQPNLLVNEAQRAFSRVFICGPGYSSSKLAVRELVKKSLLQVPSVDAIYGEDIESQYRYRKQGTDLQTLETLFAHDVDFTLLVLESPGAIAELGTFTQLPNLVERLIVLVPHSFYGAESYIARGPLSLLTNVNPNCVIYFDAENHKDLTKRVLYPLTFYKYAHHLHGIDYRRNALRWIRKKDVNHYSTYIKPIREKYNMAIALISVIVAERANYADLLLLSGLAPKQLNAALHSLYKESKIKKIYSGRYKSTEGYFDNLLFPFSSTELSKLRARLLAMA